MSQTKLSRGAYIHIDIVDNENVFIVLNNTGRDPKLPETLLLWPYVFTKEKVKTNTEMKTKLRQIAPTQRRIKTWRISSVYFGNKNESI